MRTPSFATLYGDPFVAWARLAWKTGEMMLHSGEVIGRRVTGLALAGPGDGREIALMSREKMEAAAESSYAMWWSLVRMNQQLAGLALQQMFAGAAGMASLASGTATHSARVAQRGLTPIRSRAARNAKRLRKRRR